MKTGQHGGSRDGAGRPREISGKETIPLTVSLGSDVYKDVERTAARQGISRGEVIRRALVDWFKKSFD